MSSKDPPTMTIYCTSTVAVAVLVLAVFFGQADDGERSKRDGRAKDGRPMAGRRRPSGLGRD